jgi:hypothetical protein
VLCDRAVLTAVVREQVYVEVINGNDRIVGDVRESVWVDAAAGRVLTAHEQGEWGRDFTNGKQLQAFHLQTSNGTQVEVFRLFRYDNETEYEIDSQERDYCRKTVLTGKLPAVWSWVPLATYGGAQHFHGVTLDAWQYSAAGVQLTLGVFPNNPNVPIVLLTSSSSGKENVEFRRYDENPPQPQFFDVPRICQ